MCLALAIVKVIDFLAYSIGKFPCADTCHQISHFWASFIFLFLLVDAVSDRIMIAQTGGISAFDIASQTMVSLYG